MKDKKAMTKRNLLFSPPSYNICGLAQLPIIIQNEFGVTLYLTYVSKLANPHFAWVSPLVNFKKRLFSNKDKKVIANNGTK